MLKIERTSSLFSADASEFELYRLSGNKRSVQGSSMEIDGRGASDVVHSTSHQTIQYLGAKCITVYATAQSRYAAGRCIERSGARARYEQDRMITSHCRFFSSLSSAVSIDAAIFLLLPYDLLPEAK